jgi:hypothetical protein
LNLGFGDFESDFTHNGGHLSAENKDVMAMTSHSRSMHTGPSSLAASDLKTMIAGTKKVIICLHIFVLSINCSLFIHLKFIINLNIIYLIYISVHSFANHLTNL